MYIQIHSLFILMRSLSKYEKLMIILHQRDPRDTQQQDQLSLNIFNKMLDIFCDYYTLSFGLVYW